MTIQEILYTHQLFWRQGETVWRCECGEWEDDTCAQEENHRTHLAEVLDKHMQEQCAEAKAEAYKDAERILHEEARWQLDLHQRHKEYRFKHCSERMTEMENCMTVRANQYMKDTP